MNMKKKIFIILFLVLILFANMSFASYATVKMEVVEEPVCTIDLGENSKFEKKLISKDLSNKEVTLQLEVTNNEGTLKPTGEIMLVIDNSDSMNTEVSSDVTRKDLVFESAKTLVTNLLKDNSNLQIGIVSFSSNLDVSKEGTIEDASVVSTLSNDVTLLENAISSIEPTGSRTDLDAGLELATNQFTSTDNNKYMIVLTDGVPNIAVDYDKKYYSDDVIAKTKEQLQATQTNGINLITMLTGIEDESYVPNGVTKNFGQIIQETFGTSSNPTAGKFYYIQDDKIEETITNDIYNDLLPISKTLKDITIIDYFPKEIIDNFEFAYVSSANIGNISASVDETNNSITWTIPELEVGKTATVQYKLKLKEDFDSSIVNKILDTNEKVDITYKDFEDNEDSKTSDVTPKLKLTEPPAKLPAAGKTMFIGLAIGAGILLIYSLVKLKLFNNMTK